ncbi:hypothetical protein GQR58_020919 [Nymphon striatum]|nr:hypothetical protein GQR58_020919 [Nymphon striatum]
METNMNEQNYRGPTNPNTLVQCWGNVCMFAGIASQFENHLYVMPLKCRLLFDSDSNHGRSVKSEGRGRESAIVKNKTFNALNSKNPLQTTAIPFVSLHPFVRTCVVERKFKIETVNENRTCINEMNLTQLPSVRHFHFTKSFRASHTGSMCILQDDEGILKLRTPILDCGVRNKTCPPWLVVLTEKYCIQSD